MENCKNCLSIIFLLYAMPANAQRTLENPLPKRTALSFIFYPNPATNTITIDRKKDWPKETIIHIFNSDGELILNNRFYHLEKIEIDVSAMTPGMYFVEIQTEGGRETKKMVIQ